MNIIQKVDALLTFQ